MPEFHTVGIERALSELKTRESGLSHKEAEERLVKYGPNELKREKGISKLRVFISQFTNLLIVLLIIAAAISIGVGQLVDGALILAIVITNGVFGFIQEYKAGKSIEELKKLSRPKTLALRGGKEVVVESEELVPGDIMVLEEGRSITADARIIEEFNLHVDESSLTGESVAVSKSTDKLPADTVLAERKNMVYMGSSVVSGRGLAVVTGTGMGTELGGIAKDLQEIKREQTPFQKQLDVLGKKIGWGIMIIAVVVAVVGMASGEADPLTMILIAIALGVAAIPEGLPAVITLSLALGTKSMLRRNALVRRLPVAEGLGSVDVICSDKTGTLTENFMTVKRIYLGQKTYEVSGTGYDTGGDFRLDGKRVEPNELRPILEAGLLNNDSKTAALGDGDNGDKKPGFSGDPTEIALRISAMKAGIGETDVAGKKRLNEISFTSERKMMTTVHSNGDGVLAYTKGAPEVVLGLCDRVYENGSVVKLDEKRRKDILRKNEEFASDALRVLGFAYKRLDIKPTDKRLASEDIGGKIGSIESEMVFLGLQGMIDPPRGGVKEAIKDCHDGGIRVLMITGDNLHTAKAIAKEVGLRGDAIEGGELEGMDEKGMVELVERVTIFARVSPKNKLDILEALKKNGHIVAMTGDGVNDSPALKASDVGISMGLRGTDVAKETSDIILLDDNFATIRNAVEEGRRIFDNVRKFVNYLLSCNLAEVLVVFIAGLPFILGQPVMVLSAVMLLWVNITTDGLPALALGLDPASPGILKRRPRPKTEGVINREMMYSILFMGLAITAITLAIFYFSDPLANLERSQTIAFTAIVFFELVRIQGVRARDKLSAFSNKYLLAAISSSLLLQLMVLYTPLNSYFKVIPLGMDDWVLIGLGLLTLGILTWGYHRLLSRWM